MPDKPNEYHPILDAVYDFGTSCSRDDAVKHLLGWFRSPLRAHLVPEDARPDELELYDFTLDTILTESREAAAADYSNAKYKKRSDEIIVEKLAALKKCDLGLEQAHYFFCCIDDELAMGANSALRIDKNSKLPNITLASLDQWADKKFDIHIFNPLQPPADIENHERPQNGGLSKTKATNLQITFAMLVEVFAATAPRYLLEDKPNVSAIAKRLAEYAAEKGLPGQSRETIKSCIELAMKIKKDPPI